MEFDKSNGFCNGLNIHGTSCEFTFHLVNHARSEVTMENCKKCSCPSARSHRAQYSAKKRAMIG